MFIENLKRNCPDCSKELKYTTYSGYKIANEKKSLCRSCNRKGEKNPFYGKNHSYATKKEIGEKVSLLQKGNLLSDKHKLNISKSLKGRNFSDETKQKMSKAKINRKGIPHSVETKRKIRLSRIKQIERDIFNGNQVIPSYNLDACKLIDEYGKSNGFNFIHAMNGGEHHIKDLGFFVDGYDKKKNVVIEVDEKRHFDINGNLKEKDVIRQKQIQSYLKCGFIRIKI